MEEVYIVQRTLKRVSSILCDNKIYVASSIRIFHAFFLDFVPSLLLPFIVLLFVILMLCFFFVSGEMVIEYAGELIRSTLTDQRERYYNSRGIGCYMFKIDDNLVVDATMRGNAARFINHSCEVS